MPIGPILKGAGNLNKRVQLQSATTATDSLGGTTQTWSPYATVWAAVEPQPFVVGAQQAEVITIVTIRYRDGVAAEQRVVFSERGVTATYTIVAVIDTAQEHRQLVLHCVEVD